MTTVDWTNRELRYLELCGEAIRTARAAFSDVPWRLSGSLAMYYWLERPLRLPNDVDLQARLDLDEKELGRRLNLASITLGVERTERTPFEGLIEPPPSVYQASLVSRSPSGRVDDFVILQATAVGALDGTVSKAVAADAPLPEAPVAAVDTLVGSKLIRYLETRTPGGIPARFEDAVDLVAIATSVTAPVSLGSLVSITRHYANSDRYRLVESLPSVPRGWARLFDQLSYRYDLPWRGLGDWSEILEMFAGPVLRDSDRDAVWDRHELEWTQVEPDR